MDFEQEGHSSRDLPSLGAQITRLAFRTGVHINQISRLLVQQPQESSLEGEIWSINLKGVSEDEARALLDEFHESERTPNLSQAYVSVVSMGVTTIGGPPSTLKRLETMLDASDISTSPASAPGAVNAPHLYSRNDVMDILQGSGRLDLTEVAFPTMAISSMEHGKRFSASNCHELLEQVLTEILTKTINWTNVCLGVAADVNGSECSLLTLRQGHALQSLLSALESTEPGTRATVVDIVPQEIPRSMGSSNTKIAVVGLAGRFPSAADPDLFWELLQKGRDVHRRVPPDRFDIDAHFDPTGKKKNTSLTPYGCFIDEPGLFDPRFFNMSPREAAQTDPMQRLALITAYEALEMAGCVANRTQSTKSSRVGTFYGQASDDWREVNAAQNVDTYFIPGGIRAFTPGRINYHFKFSGPSYSVDTACSSSFAAIQTAVISLLNGDCDTAVTGGVNVLTHPDIFAGLSRGQFLSKSGPCKTFDDEADGYCRADGVGSVILKRLDDAEADKDNILGVILGTKTNHSADAVSITHPHEGAQSFLYRSIIEEAGVDPHEVEYVEMHGTGTQAGDYNEMQSVTDVFAAKDQKRRSTPLYTGSVKANAGHGEASAGIMSLIKVLMMLKHNAIPPHVGIKSGIMNKTFPRDLMERNIHIPFSPTPWLPHEDGKRRLAFLNNFSAAGGNTAMLLEEGPAKPDITVQDPRSTLVVAVSAKSISSMKRNLKNLADYLDDDQSASLADLSYTTTARRLTHNYRIAFAVKDVVEVKDLLLSSIDDTFVSVPLTPRKTVFAFTGQGPAYCSLGKVLFETSVQYRKHILQLEALVERQGFSSFRPLIDGSASDQNKLSSEVVQLGLVCVQIALAQLWISWGIEPSAVVGHSLGEYAALNIAGVLSTSDTIHMVGHRARLLSEHCTAWSHAMLAVGASVSSIERALTGLDFDVSCINGPDETVLGDTQEAIDDIASRLKADGFKCTKLQVPYAFHSPQVDAILEEFENVAGSVAFGNPTLPVISPLLGRVMNHQDINKEYFGRHAREKVNFLTAITAAQQDKTVDDSTIWIEIGSHPVCLGMIKSTMGYETVTAPSMRRNEDPWKTLSTSLAELHCQGLKINWTEYHRDFDDAHQLLTLPSYSFDSKKYWLEYTNNWCLTKGDDVSAQTKNEPTLSKPKLSTTTVQSILEEDIQASSATLLIQSDLSTPALRSSILGHLVNGAGLCPSSIYADIALTIADYLRKEMQPDAPDIVMDVCSMEVDKPLILAQNSDKPQLLRVATIANLNSMEMQFFSVSESGTKLLDHAKCRVKYGDAKKWLSKWQPNVYMVEGRIESLENAVQASKAHQIGRGMVYKLFSALVQYDEEFRGMDDVYLDSANFEASSKVTFKCGPGDFFINPHWIDSLAHLAGFIVNASDSTDSQKEVYISHGWRSLRFSSRFSTEKTYRNYVKMQEVEETGVKQGDVYILEGNTIVGVVGGMKFQCIPRKLLNMLLPPRGDSATSSNSAGGAGPAKSTKGTKTPADGPPTGKVPAKVESPTRATVPKSKPSTSSANSASARALKVIAEECEIEASELVDSCAFANIGVDSLLSLTILAKLREEIDTQLSSSLFIDYPSVGELKSFLNKKYPPDSVSEEPSSSGVLDENDSDQSTSESSLQSTPRRGSSSATSVSDENEHVSLIIRSTIADEMGVDLDEVSDTIELASMGMDSLMSLSILAGLREKIGGSLPSDLLSECATIRDIEKKIGITSDEPKPMKHEPQPVKSQALPVKSEPQAVKNEPQPVKSESTLQQLVPKPSAKSVSFLMQGDPKTAASTLFLFPDGSGSATSYAPIPPLGEDVCVFGLNCPFMKTPEDFTCGIQGVTSIYLEEVKRRQPTGPYNLGGWSAGGVMAYEGALQLQARGETVSRLLLLDAPCPVKLEPVPSKLFRFFDSIGVLGNGNPKGTPAWVIPHFESMIRNLDTYAPKPFPPGKEPKVYAVWARDGVCKHPNDPRPVREDNDPKVMDWLLNNRTDFGCNGWDQLLGEENFTNVSMPGHHFTMVLEPLVRELGQLIRKAFD
ncbi:MAG: Type I Iterative PKS [Sclerophora amabilis]|nr:MAG: Type I Iterative PKS [Sclerophora amabilis]